MRGHSPEEKLGWRNLQDTWGLRRQSWNSWERSLARAKGAVSVCQAAEKGRWRHISTSTRGCKVGVRGWGGRGGPLPAF